MECYPVWGANFSRACFHLILSEFILDRMVVTELSFIFIGLSWDALELQSVFLKYNPTLCGNGGYLADIISSTKGFLFFFLIIISSTKFDCTAVVWDRILLRAFFKLCRTGHVCRCQATGRRWNLVNFISYTFHCTSSGGTNVIEICLITWTHSALIKISQNVELIKEKVRIWGRTQRRERWERPLCMSL